MFQPDLFSLERKKLPTADKDNTVSDLPGVLDRIASVCERPRYCFMVLNLIARASAATGSAGPYVRAEGKQLPIRDWLSNALSPISERDPRRRGLAAKVQHELEERCELPSDKAKAEALIESIVAERILVSGRTQVSRAVSELVRAGLVKRHYQGYRVDHSNRGAQRQVVYSVTRDARLALNQ